MAALGFGRALTVADPALFVLAVAVTCLATVGTATSMDRPSAGRRDGSLDHAG